MTSQRLFFDGPVGTIEAMLECPDGLEPGVKVPAVAVVCHPHPQFQGTMLNKVVHTLARSAIDCGIPALRFNYRGVGKSLGDYDEGRGETDDAEAACTYVDTLFGEAPLVLMGFSFGSSVALRLAGRNEPVALVVAAPPVGRLGNPSTVEFAMPWQVIQGTADELVDYVEVETWAKSQVPPPQLVVMDGVSHFFHGNLTLLRQDVRAFLIHSLDLSGA